MHRTSARTRKPTNYTTDPYKDIDGLDSDEDDADLPQANDSSADEDFELPVSERTSTPIEFEDSDSDYASDSLTEQEGDDYEEDLEETADREAGGVAAEVLPGSMAPGEDGNAACVHHTRHTFHVARKIKGRSNYPSDRRKHVVPAVLKAPDPSVKITYRPGFTKSTGKRDRLVMIFGGSKDALIKAVWIRDRWIGLPALPSKKTLEMTPFWDKDQDDLVDLGIGEQESEGLRYDGGPIDGKEGLCGVERYLPAENGVEIKCILGPLTDRKIITFKRFGTHNLEALGKMKRGFLLNAGARVLGIDWAPNKPEGDQYLAISTRPNRSSPTQENSPGLDSTSSSSSIQIWRFPIDKEGNLMIRPWLALVVCHDWGPAHGLKWCPIPQKPEIGKEKEIGYLAAVFGDGNARILKIVLPEDNRDGDCGFIKMSKPAFECRLDDTKCTTLAWITNHEIVAGCANGSIAAWDLQHAFNKNILFTPYLYSPLHQTFITQIATCYPSFPRHIITASMDGYTRLTSLLDPHTDTIVNNRSRIAPMFICWIDAINAAISSEEGAWVKFYPVRRFFSATTICKQAGVVLTAAGSFVHSSILSAGTEGEAIFSNPVRRSFHGKIKNYQQTWFQLEYAESSGMYRMNEGFKLEEFEAKASQAKQRTDTNSALVHSTVYPEQICIPQVCWNPNKICGGWATAGMACGLVRVEDVATTQPDG